MGAVVKAPSIQTQSDSTNMPEMIQLFSKDQLPVDPRCDPWLEHQLAKWPNPPTQTEPFGGKHKPNVASVKEGPEGQYVEMDLWVIQATSRMHPWQHKKDDLDKTISYYKTLGMDYFAAARYQEAVDVFIVAESHLEHTENCSFNQPRLAHHPVVKPAAPWEYHDTYVSTCNNVAICHWKRSDLGSCITYCKKVLNVDKKNFKALFRLAATYTKMDNFSAAKANIKQLKVASGDDPTLLKQVAIVNRELQMAIKSNDKKSQSMAQKMFAKEMSETSQSNQKTSSNATSNRNHSSATESDQVTESPLGSRTSRDIADSSLRKNLN